MSSLSNTTTPAAVQREHLPIELVPSNNMPSHSWYGPTRSSKEYEKGRSVVLLHV